MRLHVGCGSVFLRDWLNIDLPSKNVFLASERPDLVERFITTENAYYSRHSDKNVENLRGGPIRQETVCDAYGSFAFIPARDRTVSEIWAVQVFEHLDRAEANRALDECRRVLMPNGLLRLDIPDADETLRLYRKTGDEFFIRHLLGPRRDVYGSHVHYTREMLRSLVEEFDFNFCAEEPNIHEFYPAFTLRFQRA